MIFTKKNCCPRYDPWRSTNYDPISHYNHWGSVGDLLPLLEAAIEGNRIESLQSDWNPLQGKLVSRGSPEVAVNRPPSSVKNLTPSAFYGSRVSIAMATKSSDCLTPVYLAIFLSEASSAAAPLTADVLGKCEGAKVSGTVTSHAMDLPCAATVWTCIRPNAYRCHRGSTFWVPSLTVYWLSQAPYKWCRLWHCAWRSCQCHNGMRGRGFRSRQPGSATACVAPAQGASQTQTYRNPDCLVVQAETASGDGPCMQPLWPMFYLLKWFIEKNSVFPEFKPVSVLRVWRIQLMFQGCISSDLFRWPMNSPEVSHPVNNNQ